MRRRPTAGVALPRRLGRRWRGVPVGADLRALHPERWRPQHPTVRLVVAEPYDWARRGPG